MEGSGRLSSMASSFNCAERFLSTSARSCACDQPNEPDISVELHRTMFQNCPGVLGLVFLFTDGRNCRARGSVVNHVYFVFVGRAVSRWCKRGFRGGQSLESGSSVLRNGPSGSDTTL